MRGIALIIMGRPAIPRHSSFSGGPGCWCLPDASHRKSAKMQQNLFEGAFSDAEIAPPENAFFPPCHLPG